MNGRELAAYAAWIDVTAGLEVAALQAKRDQMPMCEARTRKIATDLGYGDPHNNRKNILILGEVTDEMVSDLRAIATEWEAILNGQRHWHVEVESADCDGRYSRTYTTHVKPCRMEYHDLTEEGFHAESATECTRLACQDMRSTQRDHSAEAAGY